MNTGVRRSVFFTVIWCIATATVFSEEQSSFREISDTSEVRALPSCISKLLTSTMRSYCRASYSIYYKRGNYRNAMKDFKKLNPTNVVKEDELRTVGKVGDSIVTVYRREFTKRGEMRIIQNDMTAGQKGVKEVSVIEYSPKPHHKQ